MGYGMNPEMMKSAPQQQNYQMNNNPAEIFMLRSQVMELNQALSREVEANKVKIKRSKMKLNFVIGVG